MDEMKKIANGIIEGEEDVVVETVTQLLKEGISPLDILDQALIPGIEKVGELYQEGEYFIPELLFGLETMNQGMNVILPYIKTEDTQKYGTVVIGTVQGDTHDIGKNIVASLLDASGFKVIDLGHDVAPEAFVEAVRKEHADIVAMSALLTSTMSFMGKTIELLRTENLRKSVKVIIGGAVITEEFKEKIGADAFAKTAMETVKIAKEYSEER
ncbi:corrinoid protein [Faecalicatena sp. Marseille-Q4148]|nr:corrinoid protein [Faecalicatena sp. Marseille-Q4148]